MNDRTFLYGITFFIAGLFGYVLSENISFLMLSVIGIVPILIRFRKRL